jgi:hypothetical protein
MILDDPGGDALDSVIAAFAVFRTLRNPAGVVAMWDSLYTLEGCVYV